MTSTAPSNDATAAKDESTSGTTTPVNSISRTSQNVPQNGTAQVPKEAGITDVPLQRDESAIGLGAPQLEEPKMTFRQLLTCCFPALGGILFGYDSGYINGVLGMKYFKYVYGHAHSIEEDAFRGHMYESWQKSLVVSILSAGTFFGALASGPVSDRVGRKRTIILGCLIYIVGVVMQVASSSVGLLSGGRAVAGLGVGFISAMSITYVSEIAPKKIRGAICSGYQFAITLGLLIAAGVDKGTQERLDTGAYRIPIAFQFAWALILMVGLLFLPESPRWHIRKGDPVNAKKSIARLRRQSEDSPFVQQELNNLTANYNEEFGKGDGGWLDCFKGGWKAGSNLRKVLLGISIQAMQQLTGINFIFYFGTTFFKSAGISDPFTITIITTVVNVASTPLSFYLIERLGRRPLLIFGALGMTVSQFIIAIVGTAAPGAHAAQVVLIVFVCIDIFFFASTWGPTCWAVCGELYPLTIRSNAIALSTASNWLFNFIIAFVTPYLVDKDKANIGSKVFFIWGSCCAVGVLYAYFFVPETRGLKLEEVDEMMKECTPRKSAGFKSGEAAARGVLEKDEEMGPTSKHISRSSWKSLTFKRARK